MNKRSKKLQITSWIIALAFIFSNLTGIKFTAKAEEVYSGPKLLITEICYNSGDEAPFIEIYNASDEAIDLSSYKIWRSTSKAASDIGTPKGTLLPRTATVISPKVDLVAFNTKYSINILQENFFKSTGGSSWGGSGFIAITDSVTSIDKTNYKTNSLVYADYSSMGVDVSYHYQYPSTGNGMNLVNSTASKVTPGSVEESQVPAKTSNPAETIAITGLTIQNKAELEVGSKLKLSATYVPENTTEKAIEWTSSNAEVAKVYADGTLEALKAGIVDITVKSRANDTITAKCEVTVKDVSLKSIKDARALQEGTLTLVEGIVTADMGDNVYIQDNTAGIVVYLKGLDEKIGDKVSVLGKIKLFNGLTEITPISSSDVKVIQENVGVPAPKAITADQNGKELEAQLVKIENTEVLSVDSFGIYTIKDSKGSTKLKSPEKDAVLVNNQYKSITGVVTYEYKEFRIVPRTLADIEEDNTIVKAVIASPSGGQVEKGTKVTLTTPTEGGEIYYTVDGSEPTKSSDKYVEALTIEKDITIKAKAFKDGLTDSKESTFSYTAVEPVPGTKISEIQGTGHESPLKDKNVDNVQGIVTAILSDKYTNGFYIQDNNPDNDIKTSEAIYVDKKKNNITTNVKVGDLVSASGLVKEVAGSYENSLTETQLISTSVVVKSSNNIVPKPIVIGKGGRQIPGIIDNDKLTSFDPEEDAIDFYESLEGMLIKVEDPLIVGAREDYGEITVVPDKGEAVKERLSNNGGVIALRDNQNSQRVIIDDVIVPITNSSKKFIDPNFKVKVGDRFDASIEGVLTYSFGNYKMLNTHKLPNLIDGGLRREITHINPAEDKLTVATYNIENFSPQAGERIAKVADSIKTNLKSPDIVGLIEVQDGSGEADNGVVDSKDSLQALVDAIKAQGGPEYGFTDVTPENNKDGGAPGGNIRPAFIYRKDRVSLVDKTRGDANTAVDVIGKGEEAGLSVNPGRIDPANSVFNNSRKSIAAEFMFKGEKVFVIANHFVSKRGDSPIYGSIQPPVYESEIVRVQQAKVVNEFMKKLINANPKANVIALGDLNDYQYSDTVLALKGDIMTNMIDELPLAERHTYVHEGNSQVLDNLLVSNNLKALTKADVVNINSEFLESEGRVSDHDPVLVQIDLIKDRAPKVKVEKNAPKSFKSGDKVKVELKATNLFKENKKVTLIVAIYDAKTNKMINKKVVTKNITAEGIENIGADIDVPATGKYKIKYFLWDDLNSMKPYTNAETIEQQP